MDLMKTFVRKELKRQIKEKYPYIQHPSGVYAKVVYVKRQAERNVCTLKVLDQNFNADDNYSEIPLVFTDISVQKGDIVVIMLLYAGNEAYILGRYGK